MLGSAQYGAPTLRTQARFPDVPSQKGHYESFYLKASAPGGGRSVWLRHTTHQRPGDQLQGSLWLTAFDAEASMPRATKATLPAAEVSAPAGDYIQIGESVLSPGRAHGSIAGDSPHATWELEFAVVYTVATVVAMFLVSLCVLCPLRLRSRSIVGPALLHAAVNGGLIMIGLSSPGLA